MTGPRERDYATKRFNANTAEDGEYGGRTDAEAAAAAASRMSAVGLLWDEDEGGWVLEDAEFDAIDALARKLESSLPPLGTSDSSLQAEYVSDTDPGLPLPKTTSLLPCGP